MGFWMVEWRIECHSPHPSVRAKEAHTSGLAGTDGDLRSDRVLGQETGTIRSFTVDTGGTIRSFTVGTGGTIRSFTVGTGGTISFL